MKIGFNGQRLAGQRLGVGRYIEYLLRYWSGMLEGDESVTLFLRQALDGEALASLALSEAIRPVVLPSRLSGIPWENLHLRPRAADLDVLFCPAYTAPLACPGRMVVATHSVNEAQGSAHTWWYRQTYGRLYRGAAQRADAVIVPCETTAGHVADMYGVAANRIAVIAQGADPCFQPMDDEAALRAVRQRYFGADRPYLLFVGKCSARRNTPMLLEAFAALKKSRDIPHGLLLFGPNVAGFPLAEMCAELGIADDVVQTDGRVASHAELVPIYNAAEVFVHPSEYEGWSMTTTEALACGTAVVASNRGGLGEVAAGHALMVDEPSAAAFAEAIGTVLEDEALRRDLQRRARERGQALTWHDTCQQTLDVLRCVAAHRIAAH